MNQTHALLREDGSASEKPSSSAGGTVVSLHVAPSGDLPMTSLPQARVVPGRDMVGDRYYLRRGRDAAYDEATCDVTLVEQETIEVMRQRDPSLDPGESARRNIVGVNPNDRVHSNTSPILLSSPNEKSMDMHQSFPISQDVRPPLPLSRIARRSRTHQAGKILRAKIRVPQRRQVMANHRFSRAILFAPGYSKWCIR